MKIKIIRYISFLMLFGLFIPGCDSNMPDTSSSLNSSSSSKQVTDATIVEFDVNEEKVDLIDVGDTYFAKKVTAKDNYGNYYDAIISATDPDNQSVTVEDDSFVCYKSGRYKVTYTVNYNLNDSISKSFHVDAIDVSAPTVDTDLYIHNICRPGQVIDLSDIQIVDNSGEEITPEIKVLFNGVEEPDAVVDNKLTASKEGTYILEISAADSNENKMLQEYYIYTLMDFEHGYSFDQNDTYGTDVVDDYAFNGSYSYEFGAFDANASWFNDYSMLGYVKILDDEAKYVSFWIYFEDEEYTNILKAIYHATTVYDITGVELPEYHLGGYEMYGGNWYRFVVNMDELVLEGSFFDHDDVEANPDTLGMIPFYFGVWDPANNTSAKRSQKVYIDDVRLTNNPEDEVYKTVESDYDFPENCVVDFETPEQKEALKASWRSPYSLSKTQKTSGEYSVRFEPYITYSSLTFTGFCSGVNSLADYNTINANFYIEDNSGNNVYDSETYINISLIYKGDDGKSNYLQSYSIKDNKKWLPLSFDLGEYNQYNLSSGRFFFSITKYIYKEVVKTYEYKDVAIYVDDIYVEYKRGHVAGEEVVNLPYASKNGGTSIYTQVSTSDTGYIEAGSLAKYGIAHGTYENYTMYNKNDLGEIKSDTTSGLTTDYQYFATKTDNIITVIEATDHCFAKFTINEEILNAYIYGNVYIRKYIAASNTWTDISFKQVSTNEVLAQYSQCDYQELQAGDKLVLDIINLAGSWRYIQNPAGVAIASPLEEGQTIQLKTPTNVEVSENYGLYTINFDEVSSAESYVMTLTDSEGNVITGYENVAVSNGDSFEFKGLTNGEYNVQIRALGTGIYSDSEISEKVLFTYTEPVELSIEEVKAALLNTENAVSYINTMKTLMTGGTDNNMDIGLLAGDTELSVAPNGTNKWCGFTQDSDGTGFRVQFLVDTEADAFYYTYTAKQSGYIYIDQTLLTWNGGTQSSIVATVGDEVVYTNERTHVGDGLIDDKIAVYLERGETLKVQVNHLSNPSRSVFGIRKVNITFVATKEVILPEGYNSLIDYLNA